MRKLKFRLDRIMFKAKDSDFKICRVYPTDSDVITTNYGNISIKGNMMDLRDDVLYDAVITGEEKSQYGYTYDVIGVVPNGVGEVDDDADMVKFIEVTMSKPLSEKIAIPGICNMIKSYDKDGLSKIKGIGGKTANKILKVWKNLGVNSKFIKKLLQLGFNDKHIHSMQESFLTLEDAINEIEKDPYILMYKRCRIRVDIIDKIAVDGYNVKKDDPRRVKALIFHTINEISSKDFRSYISLQDLVEDDRFNKLLYMTSEALIRTSLNQLIEENRIKRIDNNVGLTHIYDNEMSLIKYIDALSKINDDRFINVDLDKMIDDEEVELGFKLTQEQRHSVKVSILYNFTLIKGNAGTGKTSIVRVTLNILEKLLDHPEFVLCALSGRASQVISKSTDREASTIHRLIGFDGDKEILAEVVVVDELSMVDIDLFRKLLSAINKGTKVIVMGDDKQLPSLQYGKMIQDLLLFEKVKICSLTQVHRQALDSGVINTATDIRTDKCPIDYSGEHTLGKLQDMHIINGGGLLEKAVFKAIELYNKDDIEAMQVLCATNNMCYHVNKYIQNSVKGKGRFISVKANGKIQTNDNKPATYDIYSGDKIIITRNKYNVATLEQFEEGIDGMLPLFNGNIGKVVEIHDDYVILNIQDVDYVLQEDDYDIIQLGYAISCHKSQGGGYDSVVILVEGSFAEDMLVSNEWLYTAVTRAKKECYLYIPYRSLVNGVNKRAVNKKTTFIDLVL